MSKILEVINERIGLHEDIGYTSLSKQELVAKTGLSEDKFNKEFKKLIYKNEVFYHIEKEKVFGFDGKYRDEEMETHRRYFTNEDKFLEFSKNFKEKEALKVELKNGENLEKEAKVKELSENAQKVFNTVKEISNNENLAYVEVKRIKNEINLKSEKPLEFEEIKAAMKELRDNKISYGIFVTKDIENEETKEKTIDKKYVITNSNSVLGKVLEKEKYKEELRKNEKVPTKEKDEKQEEKKTPEKEKTPKKGKKKTPKIPKKKKDKEAGKER